MTKIALQLWCKQASSDATHSAKQSENTLVFKCCLSQVLECVNRIHTQNILERNCHHMMLFCWNVLPRWEFHGHGEHIQFPLHRVVAVKLHRSCTGLAALSLCREQQCCSTCGWLAGAWRCSTLTLPSGPLMRSSASHPDVFSSVLGKVFGHTKRPNPVANATDTRGWKRRWWYPAIWEPTEDGC